MSSALQREIRQRRPFQSPGHEAVLGLLRTADLVRRQATAALERVGASPWSDRLVRTLSAGQRRRVALAGLILSMVPLWLLDEPTTNLDTEGQQLVGSLIAEQLARGGMVVAAVHHELPATVRDLRRLELAA